MTEQESIREADIIEDAREAIERKQRYDDGHNGDIRPGRRRCDDYTLEMAASSRIPEREAA